MNKYTELISPTTLRIERFLPGPIERVWDYLVDGEKRGQWFASGTMDLYPGGRADFIFDHSKLSPINEPVPTKYADIKPGMVIPAKVVKFDPPHMLVIEWEGVVTFELKTEGEKVRLTLTHEKLKDTFESKVGTMAGWHTHLNILVDLLEGRTPKGFWSVHMPLEDEYAKRIR